MEGDEDEDEKRYDEAIMPGMLQRDLITILMLSAIHIRHEFEHDLQLLVFEQENTVHVLCDKKLKDTSDNTP